IRCAAAGRGIDHVDLSHARESGVAGQNRRKQLGAADECRRPIRAIPAHDRSRHEVASVDGQPKIGGTRDDAVWRQRVERRRRRRGSLQRAGRRRHESVDVGTDILAVRPPIPVGARRGEVVVTAHEVDEPDVAERGGEEVVGWVDQGIAARLDVSGVYITGRPELEGGEPDARAGADDALILGGDVVRVGEAGGGGVVHDDDRAGLEDGVVVDGDIGRAVEDLEDPGVVGGGVVTSSKTLSRIRIRFVCWLGALESSPRMPTPPPTWRRMLWVKVMSWTTLQGAMTSSLRTVKRIAKPICAAGQTCSKTLPSSKTRCAFFSSARFFTTHGIPA